MTEISVVLGAGFGDEGKGHFVDYLCSQAKNPLVFRFSGGSQAGHMVVNNEGKSHIFSSFGSGTLRGFDTYWSKFCTFDPISMYKEYKVLLKKDVNPKIYVSKKCPIVTPYDVMHNIQYNKQSNHGTCGFGIGSTWQREEDHYSLLFEDLYYPKILEIKLESIMKNYYGLVDKCSFHDLFLENCREITNNKNIILSDEYCHSNAYDAVVYEGSQGLLLDQNNGFFPYVTRSNTGLTNINKMSLSYDKIYLIIRAYQTRHGNGPMTNLDIPLTLYDNPDECNKMNKHQGEFRKSVLDLDLIIYALKKENILALSLVITCLDLIKDNDYKFTWGNELFKFSNRNDFVDSILNAFKREVYIGETYISISNRTDGIYKYNK